MVTLSDERIDRIIAEDVPYLDLTSHVLGIGDEPIEKAMEPMYTTKADKDRSGMGFTFMEAFMDDLKVESQVGEGTRVCMKKIIGR